MADRPARRILAVLFLLGAGILAGTQLGKLAPLVDWYRSEAGLSLVTIGWLTSTLGLFVALAALPAAILIDRFGLYRSVLASAVLLSAGAIALAFATSASAILAARVVEAAGYLLICIAAPALMAALSPASLKAPVLAVWSGFVPLGFAAADFLSAGLLGGEGPFRYLLATALLFVGLSCVALWLARGLRPIDAAPAPTGGFEVLAATLSLPVVLVSIGFGLYVVISIAFFAFLPPFVAPGGLLLSAGVIALLVPFGNVLTGVLVKGRDGRFAALLACLGFLVSAAAAIPLFAGTSPLTATAAAVVFSIAGAIVASALFASIPLIVPAGGSPAIVIGLVCQAGGIGTLIGPPLGGLAIEGAGWPGFGLFLAALSAAGALVCLPVVVSARLSAPEAAQVP